MTAAIDRHPAPVEPPALMTVRDAATYLGLGEQTVRDQLKAGTFPIRPRRLGSRLMFSRAELVRWCETPQAAGP